MYPGWRQWKAVKPSIGTKLREVEHIGYQMSGRMHIILRDGAEYDTEPDTFVVTPVGNDGYVVGDEPSETIMFGSDVWRIK